MKIQNSLLNNFSGQELEVGCDEAGRGCLAGPVFAAAVIFPKDYENPLINDSKQLSLKKREELRVIIEEDALYYAVASVSPTDIDEINILNASIKAMHSALEALPVTPAFIIVDGNKFKPFRDILHSCIVKGDSKYLSIAAASILAKTYRDEYMIGLAKEFPQYGWEKNAGYPTKVHRDAIRNYGVTPHHRLSYTLLPPEQLKIF